MSQHRSAIIVSCYSRHHLWSVLLLTLVLGLLCRATFTTVEADSEDEQPLVLYLPHITAPGSRVVIAAAHIDSAISGEPDEAILLWNIGGRSQDLAGWQLSTASRRASFPLTTTLSLAPGQQIWCAAEEIPFLHSFGEHPACVWDSAADPQTVLLSGGLALTNGRGQIQLRDLRGKLVDALLYGDAEQAIEGWSGMPAQAYARGAIGVAGQVWRRKLHPASGQPADTDTAADWAGDVSDIDWGRRVAYPGWETEELARPVGSEADAAVTVAVAPEGLYAPLNATLASARQSIDLSLYVLEHPQLAQTIAEAVTRGVSVRVLLEGSPVGGITDLQRWCVQRMASAGAEVRYLAVTEEAPRGYQPRYRYAHAKFGIVDGRVSFVGTENLTRDAAPVPGGMPAGGRRGFFLFTDAAPVAQALASIFDADWKPDTFLDLHPYQPGHEDFGGPPSDYTPEPPSEYPVMSAPFADSVTFTGRARFIVASAPENVLRPDDGLLALLDRAGPNDEILVAQLYEHKYWGNSDSNPVADPNPRLERIINAARRGARVRILLDSLYDDAEEPRSNRATEEHLRAIAANEGLDLEVRRANPTGGGLHAKLVLIRLGDETWSAVGSLNGGEVSYKLNREVVLLTDMPGVHGRLAEVFARDWETAGTTKR